jgi:hypothetical protein
VVQALGRDVDELKRQVFESVARACFEVGLPRLASHVRTVVSEHTSAWLLTEDVRLSEVDVAVFFDKFRQVGSAYSVVFVPLSLSLSMCEMRCDAVRCVVPWCRDERYRDGMM